MEWNAVLEDRLKRSKQSAGWRWVGYFGVVLGMFAAGAGWAVYLEAAEAACGTAVLTESCQGPSAWLFTGPGIAFFVLGLVVALPAEKAAKEARELKIQKGAAQSRPVTTVSACGACGTPLAGRFCAGCGRAAA